MVPMQLYDTQRLSVLVSHIVCSVFCGVLLRMFQAVSISALCSLALAVPLSICCFHVILGSNVIPKYVGILSWGSVCPFT